MLDALHLVEARLYEVIGEDVGWPAPLFPSKAARAAVVAEQHRLPMEYFTSLITVPEGWTARSAAYLAFGDTYADQRSQAAQWGWPVRTLPGGHLHCLVDPPAVATAVDELLRQQLQENPEHRAGIGTLGEPSGE